MFYEAIRKSPFDCPFILNCLVQLLVITIGMTTISSAESMGNDENHHRSVASTSYEFSISPSDSHFVEYVCSFDCGSEEHDEFDTIEMRALNRDIVNLTIHNTGKPHLGTLIVRHFDNAGNLDREITVGAEKHAFMQLRFWNNHADMLEISTTDSAFGDGIRYELEFNWDTTQRNQDWDPWIDDQDDCPTVKGDSFRILLGCPDHDLDGIADSIDQFPHDDTQWSDQDNDGFGDNLEGMNGDSCPEVYGTSTFPILGCVDKDGDGWADTHDAFPDDDKEWQDSDGDRIGDNSDAFPDDEKEWQDSDGDGIGDNSDIFPKDSSEWIDTDLDGIGDNADVFPEDATETVDSDGDGFGDNIDTCPFEYGEGSELEFGCPNLDNDDDIEEDSKNRSEPQEDMFSQDSDLNEHIESITNFDVEEEGDQDQIPSQQTGIPFGMLSMVLFGLLPMSVIGIFAYMSGKGSERSRFNERFEEMEGAVQNARNSARELEQSLQDSEIRQERMSIWIDEAKRELAPENIILRAENYVRELSDKNANEKNELEQIQESLRTTRIEKQELAQEILSDKRLQRRNLQLYQNEYDEISRKIRRLSASGLVEKLSELKHIAEQWQDPDIPAEIEGLLSPLWDDFEL